MHPGAGARRPLADDIQRDREGPLHPAHSSRWPRPDCDRLRSRIAAWSTGDAASPPVSTDVLAEREHQVLSQRIVLDRQRAVERPHSMCRNSSSRGALERAAGVLEAASTAEGRSRVGVRRDGVRLAAGAERRVEAHPGEVVLAYHPGTHRAHRLRRSQSRRQTAGCAGRRASAAARCRLPTDLAPAGRRTAGNSWIGRCVPRPGRSRCGGRSRATSRPRSPGSSPSSTMLASVMLSEPEPARPSRRVAVAVFDERAATTGDRRTWR